MTNTSGNVTGGGQNNNRKTRADGADISMFLPEKEAPYLKENLVSDEQEAQYDSLHRNGRIFAHTARLRICEALQVWYTADMTYSIPSPKAIIFDMDGVLLITTQSSDQSWHHVCQQFAPSLNLAPHLLEEALRASRRAYRQEIAHDAQKQRRDRLEPFTTRRETVERALARIGREDQELATEMVRRYEALRDEHRQLAPRAFETLQQLRDCGLPLALISNGNATYQRGKIKQHHLAPFFDAILIEEEYGVAKPDQRIFLAALDQLRVAAHNTWMIGDDLALDIAGSQQVGMVAIWCDPAKHGLPKESTVSPDHIIHALPEVLDLFEDAQASA
jgi:putative hydrolase of the HAD superfamily